MLFLVKGRKDSLITKWSRRELRLHLIQCQIGKSPKIISSPEVVGISPISLFLEVGGGH